jgi:hypothetical protein
MSASFRVGLAVIIIGAKSLILAEVRQRSIRGRFTGGQSGQPESVADARLPDSIGFPQRCGRNGIKSADFCQFEL